MGEQTFSDPIALHYYQQGERELEATQSAESILRKAELCGQQDARMEVVQSAFYYLAAARFLENRSAASSAHAYQAAASQLQRLQQCTQAGRAYSNAGRLAEQAAKAAPHGSAQQHLQHLAVRSYTRANHCFSEAGELDWSETEYIKERNARLTWARMQGKHAWALVAWRATSNFGTSFTRWSLWVMGTIGTFALLYELFFRLHWLEPMESSASIPWTPVWSGIYYSVNITSALGLVDYEPSNWISQGVVILNVLIGYLLLGLGIGIIGRMVRHR
jgi:hypothetical protein